MGWLRSVGSIKLKVSFAEYRLFYRTLLQKRPIVFSILLTEATPYERVMNTAQKSCVMWMSRISYERFIGVVQKLRHVSYERFMNIVQKSRVMWMSHATHMNESCHTCGWVVSHTWMSQVRRMNASYHMSFCQWMCHVTFMTVRVILHF